ncbi:twin transmembrane helix small protein [Ponticaulis profundi]|uniref:Twin transmembrane helix small protein n=1 Tax=Ponticaulis profundi TaxID=2665222 RepID=A0ABW1S7Q8_9PROT|tara:strand:+ start:119 stop:325 length:207 start_codon:yes stop_codon:yes gene_type:complete
MQQTLEIALYCAMALLVIILLMGIVNLVRADPKQASRSNKLMRLRVIVQAVAVAILVVIGFVSGMIKF